MKKLSVLIAVVGAGLYSVYYLLPANSLLRGAGERPNIIILLVDALRADWLSSYGYARNTSPTLDAPAERAVIFRRCYAQPQYTYEFQSCYVIPFVIH